MVKFLIGRGGSEVRLVSAFVCLYIPYDYRGSCLFLLLICLLGTGNLKPSLIDELDYQLVPEEAWTKLLASYGISDGQQAVCRKVVDQGLFTKHCKVEIYLMDLKLCSNNELESVISRKFSRADTLGG